MARRQTIVIRARRWAVVGGLFITACSHAPPPTPAPPCTSPEPLRINVAASARINPGHKGEALATVVRLYQLKGTGKLAGASFDDLLDRDRDSLGEDFVAVQEVTINPGDRVDPPVMRNPDAAYVTAVALFRQPSGSSWKATRKLPPADPQHCNASNKSTRGPLHDSTLRFFLDENRIELR